MPHRLFTTYHREWHLRRRGELTACLAANCLVFDDVTVLSEHCPRPFGFQGCWFEGVQRQKYADLLAMAADSQPDAITIIANADIMFGEPGKSGAPDALEQIGANLQDGEVYCLTRWDVLGEGKYKLFEVAHSQDVWAFRGPPKPGIGGDYPFGVPGCDNRFAHELAAAGYKVLNPSRDIRTYHLHLSGHRPGNRPENRVVGPYLLIRPHRLGERPIYKPVPAQRVSKRASQFQR